MSKKEIWNLTLWGEKPIKISGGRRQEPVDHLDWVLAGADDFDEPAIVIRQ